jgi:hypothetical protein
LRIGTCYQYLDLRERKYQEAEKLEASNVLLHQYD